MQKTTRPPFLVLISLLLLGILALGGCARLNRGEAGLNPVGSQPSGQTILQPQAVEPTSTTSSAAGQPTLTPPAALSVGDQAGGDPELDEIDRLLGDLQNQLNQTDTVGDFK